MPIMSVAWEVEAEGLNFKFILGCIMSWDQPGIHKPLSKIKSNQNIKQLPDLRHWAIHLKRSKLGVVVHACNPSYLGWWDGRLSSTTTNIIFGNITKHPCPNNTAMIPKKKQKRLWRRAHFSWHYKGSNNGWHQHKKNLVLSVLPVANLDTKHH